MSLRKSAFQHALAHASLLECAFQYALANAFFFSFPLHVSADLRAVCYQDDEIEKADGIARY